MDLGLNARACIVTGAARGIGRATALALAGEGAAVLLVGRREAPLAEVARACDDAGGRPETLVLDIRDLDAGDGLCRVPRALRADRRTRQQRRHEPVRCARAAHRCGLAGAVGAERDGADAADARGAPAMAERGWGRIVNVSSSSGKRPGRRNMAYSVTKAAELSLSRSFADLYAAARRARQRGHARGRSAPSCGSAPGGLADQVALRRGSPRAGARGDRRQRAARAARHRTGDRGRDHVPVLGGGA